jgi:hypothetical protein
MKKLKYTQISFRIANIPTTANIGKRGEGGYIEHPDSVSSFSSTDTNELRKSRLPILANRCSQLS